MSDYNDNDIAFQFLLANVQSIKSKEYILRDELNKNNATFAVITKTWVRNDDVAWVECSQFNTDGYKFVTANRRNRKCDGLALIYNEENTVKIIQSDQKRSFEYPVCSIVINSNTVTVAMIYRQAYLKKKPITSSMCIHDLAQFLQDILTEYKNIVILGYLKLHPETDDPDAMVCSDIVDPMGFIPRFNIPTHKAGHTLYQVYTVLDGQVTISECWQGLLLSDHVVRECRALIPRNSTITKTVTSRKLKIIDCILHERLQI